MHIEGLVSASRQAREALRRGIAEEDREEFRAWVRDVVMQVEEICDRYGATPDELPGPSREAWRFLRRIDLERLPGPPPGAPPPRPPIRIPGVLAEAEELAGFLWEGRGVLAENPGPAEAVATRARYAADGILETAEYMASTPAALPARSRAAYALVRWLADEGHVTRCARTLLLAEAAILPALTDPFEAWIFPASKGWTVRRRWGQVLVRLHPAFLAADDLAFAALRQVLRPDPPPSAARYLRRMMRGAPAAAVLAEFDMALS